SQVGTANALKRRNALWEQKVIEERFGPTVVPVPFLEDAASYDLLTVLIKKPQLGHGLLRRPRCLVPIGPLESLVSEGTATRELTLCTREYNARVRGESRYEETRLVDGALRRIRLTMAGVHKKVAFLVLRPGAVALRPGLPWLRSQHSLYVVYEVFYCGSLGMSVTQGTEHRTFHRDQPQPVAFSCVKFALNSKGLVGSQKPMGHRLPARAAWVRMAVLEKPTLAVPLVPSVPRDGTEERKRWAPLSRSTRTLAGEDTVLQELQRELGLSRGSIFSPRGSSVCGIYYRMRW
uniref:Chromosome 11 open reading frame 42 n=1 Tax=Salvator merianae TaxID=96440 RepID=A0A8D0DK30_SALMN